MSILSKILGRKDAEQQQKTGGMEDFMTLIRVYFQAAMAADLGITNLAALHVPTVNNRLGIGERTRCKKMLKDMYDIDEFFFKEIDSSLRKRCRRLQDVQTYMIQFQNFTQDLMMLLSNLMKFKLRLPSFMKKTLRSLINKTVDDIFNKNDYTDAAVLKTAVGVRQYAAKLGFSQQWTALFAEKVVMLAKKEPRPKDEDIKK